MRRSLIPTICAIAAAACCVLAGCGGKRPYPVLGQVIYSDGSQATDLAGASVIFTSQELKTSASGEIDGEGRFTLTTHRNNDGALPGSYKVVIALAPDFGADDPKLRRPKSRLAGHYADPSTTDLLATVEPKTNRVTLTLSPKNSAPR